MSLALCCEGNLVESRASDAQELDDAMDAVQQQREQRKKRSCASLKQAEAAVRLNYSVYFRI